MLAIAFVSTTAMAGNDKHATKKEPAKAKAAPPPEEAAAGSADAPPADPLADLPQVMGPKKYDLGHNAEIDIPAGMRLFDKATSQMMIQKGGGDGRDCVAIVAPAYGKGDWIVIIEADDNGYVTDSDADQLDANAMLQDFKTATEEQNTKRAQMGVPALHVDSWSNPPTYDKPQHHLVWGLNGHGDDGKVINYFTRFLGRGGYLSLNLIDDPATIEQSKQQALAVLQSTHFKPGFTYADYKEGDKSSGLGLKALVIGGGAVLVAKKTGLLIGLLLILKKVGIFIVAGIAGFFKMLFGRKKNDDVASGPPPMDPMAPPGDPNV